MTPTPAIQLIARSALVLLCCVVLLATGAGSAMAQDGTPNGTAPMGVYPTGNELPACEYPCRIYAAVPGWPWTPFGVAGGIYEINVCGAISVKLLAPLPGAWDIAAAGGNAVMVDNGAGLYRFDLTTGIFTKLGSGLPAFTNSFTEVDDLWYAGEGMAGTLYRVTAGGGTLAVGAGPPAAVYTGDLVYWPDTPIYAAVGPFPGLSAFVAVSRRTGAQFPVGAMGASIIGLAYDGSGLLWGSDDAGNLGLVSTTTGAWTNTAALPIVPYDLASTPRCGDSAVSGDLGDAPDSTNHTTSTMSAYPLVQAGYPTVYDVATGTPQGPMHWLPEWDAWLGAAASSEADADLFPDDDLTTNIQPPLDTPDLDGADDGLLAPVALPNCGLTQLQFTATVAGDARDRYANAWIDFNQDGDWEDTLTCLDPVTQQQVYVPEWVIQDQVYNVGSGTHTITSQYFRSLGPDDKMWLRLTTSESVTPAGDGSGPSEGYEFGETEDYLLVPDGAPGPAYHW